MLSVLVQAIRIRWIVAALFAACALLPCGSPARAHIIPGAVTLEQLIRAADVVVVARIVNPLAVVELDNPSRRRPVVDAEVMQVLKGDEKRGPVRFVSHAHGGAEYARGEEVLLFLQRIEKNREFAGVRFPEAIRYAGIDDVSDHFTLSATSRDVLLAAVRDYTAAISEDTGRKGHAVAKVTLRLLGSKEPKVAASALRAVVLGDSSVAITETDLPELLRLVADASRPIDLRVGLLIELDRRKLVDAVPQWVRLLKETRPADIPDVARGAGKRRHPEITRELVRWMESGNGQVAPAAAVALGSPGNDGAVEPLGRALQSDDGPLRRAAVRSLGKIGSVEARLALRQAAESHFDPDMRRLARTELNLLGEPPKAPPPAPAATGSQPSVLRTHWRTWAFLMLAAGITLVAGLTRWARRK